MVHSTPANPSLNVKRQTSGEFEAEDAADSRFFIAGRVRSGILTFVVVAELPDGTRGTVRGIQFFDALMSHFQQVGTAITTIEAEWSVHSPDLRTNIDVFNRLTAAGHNAEDAALQTPTGKYAARYSYTKVMLVRALPPGSGGKYQEVLARFTK